LSTDINHIDIYLIKQQSESIIDLNIPDTITKEVQSKYKNWKTTKYIGYARNHLTYLYNLTDDSQIVYTKVATEPSTSMSSTTPFQWHIIPYTYSKLPTHIFPCTNDVNDVCEYILTEAKITNRITLVIRKDQYGTYLYIEYKHSPNVDIEKSQNIIQELMRNVYKT
jgi:hypothetical protein